MSVRRALAVAAALPLLLAGCSEGEAEPKMPDPSPSSSSSTPTAEPTAEQETPEEFIRRWQKAALDAQNEGDTSEYRSMGPNCRPCSDFADQVDRIYADGGSVKLASLRVVSVEGAGADADQFKLVRVLGPTRVLDAAGQQKQSFAGGREVLSVFLEKRNDAWRVRNFLRTPA